MADGVATEDTLPDLPQCKMIEQPMFTKSRPHTLSAPGISTSLYETKSPGSSRCSSPRLRRSLDLIRISRTEWEQRERALSSLRADKNELNAKFRQHTGLVKSYDQLQKACLQLAHLLGCSAISEITPETVSEVICPKAIQLTSDISLARRQISTSSEDLAKVRGELSGVSAKLSISEAEKRQFQTMLKTKDSEIQQLRGEVDRLKQSEAHSSTKLQSLKDEISMIKNTKQAADTQDCKKHNEITTLKQSLGDKDDELAAARDKISTLQLEKTELEERCLISDAAYEEVCMQLAETLNIDQSDSCDFDKMVTKVKRLIEDCNEQRMKIESLTHLKQVTELDSKANRETILRLVADVKKHEQQSTDTVALQQTIGELKEKFEKSEKDRISLSERLTATQSSVAALQHEVKAKEKSQEDMRQLIEILKSQNKREEIDCLIEPYTDLCSKLRSVLKCSSDEMILVSVTQLIKDRHDFEMKLADSQGNVRNTLSKLRDAQHQLKEAEDDVISQRSKLADMEKQLETNEILQHKLKELNDKYTSFLKRLLKHLKVESGLVLVGEFAEDAALVRIDQLSKLESQAVAEKQSAYYSSQRKLKSCRQQLEAKEMQLGLLQRKVSVLETRLSEVSDKEIEWNAAIDKGKRTERQIEKLQEKIIRQQETISELRVNTSDLNRLKAENQKMEEKITELQRVIENLQQSKVHLSQQLAEARHRAQTVVSQDKERAEKAEELLGEIRTELKDAVRVKAELSVFQDTVKQLMSTVQHDEETLECEEDTLKKIESLILEWSRYREMSNNLQTSLKQLEIGFKRGYQDTLTLLNTN